MFKSLSFLNKRKNQEVHNEKRDCIYIVVNLRFVPLRPDPVYQHSGKDREVGGHAEKSAQTFSNGL